MCAAQDVQHRLPLEPLSVVDAAWMRMDSPENLMIITSLMTFEEPLDRDELQRVLARLIQHRRFRQHVVRSRRTLGRAAWEDDPALDLARHVRDERLPPPGGDAELAAFVERRMREPFDRARPLWTIDVVHGWHGDGMALVARMHHCLADGIALVRVLLGLTDEGRDLAPVDVGVEPDRAPHAPLAWARHEAARARTLARLVLLRPDPHTPLRGPLGVEKRVAWSGAVPLDRVRAIARAHGAHVNDVLVAAFTGALRDHLVARAALPIGRDLRAIVPMYIRTSDGEAGNHFGLVYLDLPTREAHPVTRLRAVHERMDAIKASLDAGVAFEILAAFGAVGPSVERLGIELFTSKATVMVTNVPGPPARVHIAGKPISGMMVWAPTSGRLGMGVCLISYANEVRLGIAVDASLIDDPAPIALAFERELGVSAT